MKSTFILFLLSLGILVGCSGKQGTSVVQIASTVSLEASDLDILLIGRNKTTLKTFSKIIQGNSNFVLENGQWDFHVVSWDKSSSSTLTGTNYCGTSSKTLVGEDVSVVINVTASACATAPFSAPGFLDGSNFQTLKIVSCSDLTSVADGYSSCSGVEGEGQSYKISLLPYQKGVTEELFKNEVFHTNCVTNPVTNLRLPVKSTIPVYILIRSFESTNCSPGANDKEFIFKQGLRELPDAKIYSGGGTANLYLKHSPVMPPNNPPVAQALSTQILVEDTELTITLPYTDADAGDLAVSCGISNMVNVIDSTSCSCDGAGICAVGIKGNADYFGAGSFDFYVYDGTDNSSVMTVPVNISSVNDAPVITGTTAISIPFNNAGNVNVSVVDIDSALDCMTSITALSDNGSIIPSAGVTFSGTAPSCMVSIAPAFNVVGSANVTLTLSDGSDSSILNILVTVEPPMPLVSYDPTPMVFTRSTTITPVVAPTYLYAGDGGATVVNCTANPSLPLGIDLDTTTCEISGTPSESRAGALYDIQIINSYGGMSTTPIDITVLEP